MRLEVAQAGKLGTAAKGGAAAGLVGGGVLWLLGLIGGVVGGLEPWVALKLPAAPFTRDAALAPGFAAGPVLAGIVCHFVLSVIWGVGFGLLVWGLKRSQTVLAGPAFGLLVWATMYYVILPFLGLSELVTLWPLGASVLAHVVFGGVLGVAFLPFQEHVPVRVLSPEGRARGRTLARQRAAGGVEPHQPDI